jgi:heme O synthase-like polyprenyltransferase
MANKAKSRGKKVAQRKETDSAFLLKLVLYVIVGSIWIKVTTDDMQYPIPIGFMVGLFFAFHDHFKIDRKIEFALLLVAMLIGFWTPVGIYIGL